MSGFLNALGSIGQALISPVTSIVGGLMQNNAQKKAEKRQFEYSKQLAAYQNDMNVANWERQNEYNSPANQMKRLQEAGLNPNLMYGNGTASAGNADSVHSVSASLPSFNTTTRFNIAPPNLLDAMLRLKQGELIDSQVQAQNALAALYAANADKSVAESNILGLDLNLYKDTYGDRRTYYAVNNSNILQNIKESQTRVKLNNVNAQVSYQNISYLQSKRNLTDAQATVAYSNAKYLAQQILSEQLKQKGYSLDNALKARSMPLIVSKLATDIVHTQKLNNQLQWDYDHNYLNKISREFDNLLKEQDVSIGKYGLSKNSSILSIMNPVSRIIDKIFGF